jgi:hypothetical protein
VPARPLNAEVTRFDAESAAEVAAEFLGDDGIEAMVVGDPSIGFAVVVHRQDLSRALVLLGVTSTRPASSPASTAGDPWDQPLPPSSIWRRPPWVRAVGLLVVAGLVVPAVVGLLRWLG